MHRVIFTFVLVLAAAIVTACGTGSNAVSAVTPLPTDDIGEVASAEEEPATNTPVVLSATPTMTATPSAEVASEAAEAEATEEGDFPNALVGSNSANSGAFPTANPFSFAGLEPGVAREIALATDIPMQPTVENRLTFDEDPVPLTFSEFYDGFDLRRGLIFSDKLLSLDGQRVVIEGYVAPPLKPRIDFFVLTRIQLAFCPFCSTDVEWPNDIALVYMPEQEVFSGEFPVRVVGQLEVGSSVDAESGMVSLVRIYMESLEQIR